MLDYEKILAILKPEGVLSSALKGFESREAQVNMMRNILDAYHQDAIALIEAGTGTGKSISYLIPALLWAVHKKERTVISTNTINLQEQLIYKDIPMLVQALNIDVKAVLVKGMNNYICLRKLEEAKQEMRLFPSDESEEIERIDQSKGAEGSKSGLPLVPSAATWERIGAESDTCNHQECPHFQECFFFKARKKAADAQILVANHHMLFTDLVCRGERNNYKDPCVLPAYNRIVLDEAHNIEDIATEYFASRVTRLEMMRTLGRITSEKQGKAHGKLPQLKEKFTEHFGRDRSMNISKIFNRLNTELPGLRNDLLLQINSTFQAYTHFANILQDKKNQQEDFSHSQGAGENKLRLLEHHLTHPHWEQDIKPQTKKLTDAVGRYVQALLGLEADLQMLANERFQEQVKSLRYELTAMAGRLSGSSAILMSYLNEKKDSNAVRWIELQTLKTIINTHLVNADLDIASHLVNFLFSKFPTVILCSATLAANRNFSYTRKRLGITEDKLPEKKIIEQIYESPFNFQQQALFAIPTDVPSPSDPAFTEVAAERIWEAIQASRGNAFVLFTSYGMLKTCHQILEKRLQEHRYTVFKQGDDNRASLLNRFKTTNHSVLFGTDSFWEGVDVAGDALRCVIIVKLPFKVPTEPIIQARTEAIQAEGGDPFMDYSLPNAIVKFKQGFGRLIRNKRDRGCIVCLDTRLIHKGYGKQFLNSLPKCQFVFAESSILQKEMTDFYRRTYHLVVK